MKIDDKEYLILREEDARQAFAEVLEISPGWVPSEDDFSPSVRSFVAAMQAEASDAAEAGEAVPDA